MRVCLGSAARNSMPGAPSGFSYIGRPLASSPCTEGQPAVPLQSGFRAGRSQATEGQAGVAGRSGQEHLHAREQCFVLLIDTIRLAQIHVALICIGMLELHWFRSPIRLSPPSSKPTLELLRGLLGFPHLTELRRRHGAVVDILPEGACSLDVALSSHSGWGG